MYLQIWSLIVAARFVKIESDACFDVIAQFSIVFNFWLVNLSSLTIGWPIKNRPGWATRIHCSPVMWDCDNGATD